MNKQRFFLIFLLLPLWFLFSAEQAEMILQQVEDNLIGENAPQDISSLMQMSIIRSGEKKERLLEAWTKNNRSGDDWRVLKFKSPADVKGIALLVLSEDQMYIYLPEFKRVRRIASSNKKGCLFGSDFSYEDLSTSGFSRFYNSKLSKEDGRFFYLELTPKPEVSKPYSRIELIVEKSVMLPAEIKMFGKNQKLWKHCLQKFQKVGKYNIINYFEMNDLQKNSRTILELKEVKVDQNVDDEIFSERFLKK